MTTAPGNPDPDSPVQDVPKTAKERILGALGGAIHAGTGQGPATESPLFKKMQDDHQKRLDLARHHQKQWATARQVIITGIDPQTGKPLTGEEAEHWKNIMDAEQGEYEKAAGTSKETKEIVKRHIGLVDHIGNIFKQRQQQQTGGLPAPPKAGEEGAQPQTTLPAPPSSMERSADIGQAAQFQEQHQAEEAYKKKSAIDTQAKIDIEKAKPGPEDKTDVQMWRSAYKREHNGQEPSTAEIEKFRLDKENPENVQIRKAIDLANQASQETDPDKKAALQQQAKDAFAVANTAAVAKKPPSQAGMNNMMAQVIRSIDPNVSPEDRKLANAAVNKMLQGQYFVRSAFATERARNQFGTFEYGPGPQEGQVETMSMLNARKKLESGQQVTYIGQPSFSTVTSLQKFTQEAPPAIEGFRKEVLDNSGKKTGKTPLDAFDNPSDRAIFARVFNEVGNVESEPGGVLAYAGKLLDQLALHEGELSPEGRELIVTEGRVMDTLFTAQTALGAQKTDTATNIFRNMLPGPRTPDKKFAEKQLNAFESNVKNTLTPAMRGLVATPQQWKGGPPAPPKSTQRFKDGATNYNVPVDQIPEFKKDHPKAVLNPR